MSSCAHGMHTIRMHVVSICTCASMLMFTAAIEASQTEKCIASSTRISQDDDSVSIKKKSLGMKRFNVGSPLKSDRFVPTDKSPSFVRAQISLLGTDPATRVTQITHTHKTLNTSMKHMSHM